MRLSIGIEGTFAPLSGHDTLSPTGHHLMLKEDFGLIKAMGIEQFRYPIPWHRVERLRGTYNWRYVDEAIRTADELGLSMIADTLHHTSYPAWLRNGFLDGPFEDAYVAFVRAFAQRYPMVQAYTPFNEPTCTLDFCGYRGFWHPYGSGDESYVTMLKHTSRATARVIRMLREIRPHARIIHVDTFEHHAALDAESEERAFFLNERRFLFEELIAGTVNADHYHYPYLAANGFHRKDFQWHLEHPATIHERGGNYYPLCEEQLPEGRTLNAPSLNPKGFSGVVLDYSRRCAAPLSLTETNIQGSVADRISWLKYMLEQAEVLHDRGVQLEQFAWYPLFDCTGWHCMLQGDRWNVDPQGIYSCDTRWNRVETALSRAYSAAVKAPSGSRASKLPAYRFQPKHGRTLGALMPHMQWAWQEPPSELCADFCD